MDYLDPHKESTQRALLFTGYVLVAVAILLAARLLLLQAYGFGLGKNGAIIQNGLTFFSSHPKPAQIYINSKLNSKSTNTRLLLPSGIYNISLYRTGYQAWQRKIELDGGSVEHFDYPFLIPDKLDSAKLQPYSAPPAIVTQSPDRRWLLVGKPDSVTGFDLFDLKNQNSAKAPTAIVLPDNLLTQTAGSGSWQLAEWADDNQHVLLLHTAADKTEYILVDRANPDQSVNLSSVLGINSAKVMLRNKKFDQYYLYDAASATVQTANLKSTIKTTVLQHVLAFQPYASNTILYATDSGAPAGKVLIKMLVDTKSTTLRSLPTSPNYVLDLTQYNGTTYVAMGATSGNKVYIYQDPLGQLAAQPDQAIVPTQVLHVEQPNYVSFSDNAQFIVAENGQQFGVYDIENDKGYNYISPDPLDAPAAHASWMDGDRLNYVSNGKVIEFDYDHTNLRVLVPASSQYLAAFAPDYKFVYTVAQNTAGQYDLNQTWLLAPADR